MEPVQNNKKSIQFAIYIFFIQEQQILAAMLTYHSGRVNWLTVGVSAAVVQELGHVGKGFGTEGAPVERLRCVGLPVK